MKLRCEANIWATNVLRVVLLFSFHCMHIFFLEYAGELRIIVLSRKLVCDPLDITGAWSTDAPQITH
jgi:hypothetical protein